jgi:magnesium chelatase subunit I
VIHFGLVPRSHRGIFVINELPDLQPRIQVALFNILQEGDVQIRGFKLRLPLDIQFVFTANPEDYTNRGAIITPLKDRIQSQILTHYPPSIELGMRITAQELRSPKEQLSRVRVPDLLRVLIERIALEARDSEYVDRKSGVSARLTISALESVISAAELRALRNGEDRTVARIGDLQAVVPAITGKVELVYEGEQEGPEKVAHHLMGLAVRHVFAELFPAAVRKQRKAKAEGGHVRQPADPVSGIVEHFEGTSCDLPLGLSSAGYAQALHAVPGLLHLVRTQHDYLDEEEQLLWAEFVLHGLAEHSRIGRTQLVNAVRFGDLMSAMLGGGLDEEENG